MGDYDLSPEAERDLFEIALYGLENFGLARSEEYRDGLNACFQQIAPRGTKLSTTSAKGIGVASTGRIRFITALKGRELPSCEYSVDRAWQGHSGDGLRQGRIRTCNPASARTGCNKAIGAFHDSR